LLFPGVICSQWMQRLAVGLFLQTLAQPMSVFLLLSRWAFQELTPVLKFLPREWWWLSKFDNSHKDWPQAAAEMLGTCWGRVILLQWHRRLAHRGCRLQVECSTREMLWRCPSWTHRLCSGVLPSNCPCTLLRCQRMQARTTIQ